MSSTAQRSELQSQIWKISNDVRGSIDGWDFKQYVLGTLFYRFISENFSNYIEGGDESINYSDLSDEINPHKLLDVIYDIIPDSYKGIEQKEIENSSGKVEVILSEYIGI